MSLKCNEICFGFDGKIVIIWCYRITGICQTFPSICFHGLTHHFLIQSLLPSLRLPSSCLDTLSELFPSLRLPSSCLYALSELIPSLYLPLSLDTLSELFHRHKTWLRNEYLAVYRHMPHTILPHWHRLCAQRLHQCLITRIHSTATITNFQCLCPTTLYRISWQSRKVSVLQVYVKTLDVNLSHAKTIGPGHNIYAI